MAPIKAPAHGLPRKLKYAFVLQATMAIVAIVLGAYLASTVALREWSQRSLLEEADYFWEQRRIDPAHPVPHGQLLRGHFVATANGPVDVPATLRDLPEGIHDLDPEQLLVLVQRRGDGTLYLSYQQPRLNRMLLWVELVPVLLALLAILGTSWFAYRMARRMVDPLAWLAQQVGRWNPAEFATSKLDASALPEGAGVETRQLASALQSMGQKLRDFVRRERNFTRDASHELRTPVTVIRVAADLMQDDPDLPQRSHRSLERIRRATRDMEAVIDAFLILARDASVEPQRETFDVHEVVYEEVEKARALLEGKPVELHLHENAQPRLHASPRVLSVMLGHLLRNACTFTERGEIDVVLEKDRISVRDTGIGMCANTLARAYDPFYRADIANPERKGMGLAIVARLGERFGWPVQIDSEPGEGTLAIIRFQATAGDVPVPRVNAQAE